MLAKLEVVLIYDPLLIFSHAHSMALEMVMLVSQSTTMVQTEIFQQYSTSVKFCT